MTMKNDTTGDADAPKNLGTTRGERDCPIPTGSVWLHCHRCGWQGKDSELDVNEYGEACPRCPQHRDIHASLEEIEKPTKVRYDIVKDADGWRLSKTPSNHIILATLSTPFRFKWQAKLARRKLLSQNKVIRQ